MTPNQRLDRLGMLAADICRSLGIREGSRVIAVAGQLEDRIKTDSQMVQFMYQWKLLPRNPDRAIALKNVINLLERL